nr:uncharacterized protein LOC113825424 [Penaeus vannamei]
MATSSREKPKSAFREISLTFKSLRMFSHSDYHRTHLFAYADDLQLISTGTTRIVRAQQALDLIVDKCHTLGLKLNPEKNRALQVRRYLPHQSLYIRTDKIEWVTSHKCLGIVFNTQNDSSSQLRHLLEKTKTRINVLRRLLSSKMGAGFNVLRAFYIHAIRSLVDYCSFSILSLSSAQFIRLETIQNKYMRIILGAPRWTRLVNMRLGTKLIPLQIRTQQIVAGHVSKLISHHHPPLLKDRFINLLTQPGGPLPTSLPWHSEVFRCLDAFNLLPSITSRSIDHPHREYRAPLPWEPRHVTITTKSLPLSKARCSQNDFRHLQASIDSIENNEDIATFYTDGSVEQSGRAGAAFMHDRSQHGQRLSNDTTILQAELFAIRAALHCAFRCAKNTVYILTDSLSALHTLQQQYHQDNIQLITSTLFKFQQLSEQGKSVTLMWIPSHVGIQHNELVDTAAKNNLRQQSITHVKPSLSTIKTLARSAAYYMTLYSIRSGCKQDRLQRLGTRPLLSLSP